MLSFVPIVIVVIMVIAITSLLINLTKRSSKVFFSGNRIRWMFVGYLSILLICTGLSPLLPKGEITYQKIDANQLEKDSEELYEAAISGNIENVHSKYIVKNRKFDYTEKQLDIAVVNEDFLSASIIVERKTTNDQKIEALHYQTGSGLNEMSISDLMQPLGINIDKNTLILENPPKIKLEFSQFQQAFPINQFTGKGDFSDTNNFIDGTSILYLKIPKDLELTTTNEIALEYVE
ncbi:hypothetical protein [Neobacillus sp. DY30]|uniref:hypothetical protein n=1 Tax=Neobacillus sp. DY30 TaxID=3047871 RepID=UPI0024BF6604|nr:hypothetical protein [Neobacillus sp. DY30]WHY01296.1 hypothetical protein QNH29_03265 [Neobacillus sp. DY30]